MGLLWFGLCLDDRCGVMSGRLVQNGMMNDRGFLGETEGRDCDVVLLLTGSYDPPGAQEMILLPFQIHRNSFSALNPAVMIRGLLL